MVTCLLRLYSEYRTGNASKFRLNPPFFFFFGAGEGGVMKCNIDNDDKCTCNFVSIMMITSSFN